MCVVFISLPLSIHVSVAASGVAVLSPTPTPFNTAIVASVPVIDEQNACHENHQPINAVKFQLGHS